MLAGLPGLPINGAQPIRGAHHWHRPAEHVEVQLLALAAEPVATLADQIGLGLDNTEAHALRIAA